MDIKRITWKRVKNLFLKRVYAIGYRKCDCCDNLIVNNKVKFSIINPTLTEWYADPFVISSEEHHYLFAEVMNDFNENRGYLAVRDLAEKDGEFIPILQEPFHLSFPNIFNYKNDYYMIPETNEINQIRLYKATGFPYEWKLERIIIDNIKAVDTVVFFLDKYWILETHLLETEENRFYLYDFDTRQLEIIDMVNGKFINKRPGGSFFMLNGEHYHVLQECERLYGEYLHLGKIQFFNESEIEENEISQIKCGDMNISSKLKYIHTYNTDGKVEVVDFMYYQLNFTTLPKKIYFYLKKKYHCKKEPRNV